MCVHVFYSITLNIWTDFDENQYTNKATIIHLGTRQSKDS